MMTEFRIFHNLSSPYYPWANGQAESTNKVLVSVIHKSCGVEEADWEERLPAILWAYRTMYKVTTGHTPFQLMYGQEAVMPMEYMVPSLRIAVENRLGDTESLKERLYQLNKLDERRVMAQWATENMQRRQKYWHDKHLRRMNFRPGQLVLKYNGRNEIKPGKFKVRWLGPFWVREVGDNGSIKLENLDGSLILEAINGSKLKPYQERKEKNTIAINMLGYATKEDWSVQSEGPREQDWGLGGPGYVADNVWAESGRDQINEERLAEKWVEGIAVPWIHKHLTNAVFGTPALWRRMGGHWHYVAPYEGIKRGYIAKDLDAEAQAEKENQAEEQDELQKDDEEEWTNE